MKQLFFAGGPGGSSLFRRQGLPRLGLPVVLLFCSASLFADVELNIQYYNKRIYYVQDGADQDRLEPIAIQVTLTNNTPTIYRFKLADERVFSLDFEVRTTSNRAIAKGAYLMRKRTEDMQIYYREVAVMPGESFSFVEDLRNYADLRQSGAFVIWARMYPELYKENASVRPLESNRLPLNLRPPTITGPDGAPLAMDVVTNAVLVREKLPPDEVIRYLLTARQKAQWEKFFLYLDVEAMIKRDGVLRRQWLAAPEEGRRQMIARYRTDLQSEVVDGDIATIPISFDIEQTSYTKTEATVIVLERFKVEDIILQRRYTYTLHRRDEFWTVVDFAVVNLGTE